MKFKNVFLAFFVLFFAFSLASCNNTNSTKGYVGGDNGLLVSFLDDSPPDVVYDSSSYAVPVTVKVRNDGEFDIPSNKIFFEIGGISTSEFNINLDSGTLLQYKEDAPQIFRGKTLIDGKAVDGDEDYVTLEEEFYYKNTIKREDLTYPLIVDVCYPYVTLATAQVCLKGNYQKSSEVCDPATTTGLSVSGAPVKITNLKEYGTGDTLNVEFDIRVNSNVKGVYAPMPEQRCKSNSLSEDAKIKNWVYVRVDGNNNGELTCLGLQRKDNFNGQEMFSYPQSITGNAIRITGINPTSEGYVRLDPDTGSKTVKCRLKVDRNTDAKVGSLDIAVSYYVADRTSKDIKVTHIEDEGNSNMNSNVDNTADNNDNGCDRYKDDPVQYNACLAATGQN